MSPERFARLEELYHEARARNAEDRATLLAGADPELRREVESLLAQGDLTEFSGRPEIRDAARILEDMDVTALEAGATLGPYRIEGKLGEGGMGEVYRAVDTRLGRVVAVKTTRRQFNERFEREARAIASLNHPNICTLHDVGPNYIVMELVEGQTLAERLKSGPLPMETALPCALQIAAALEEAHARGIVHRDLKPGNIMMARTGAKVMDFGLARSGQDETVTARHMIIGTPAYMSPEQRGGKTADARSDIYSFGCVLHEIFTGKKAMAARSPLPSRSLERIVSRCLEEDPARRWQSVTELQRELAVVTPSKRGWLLAAGAALVVVSLLAAVFIYGGRTPKLTVRDPIVLGEFENKTGDAVFDQTLRQGLAVQLEQSPVLALVSEQKIQQTLRLMNRPAGTTLTSELSREICSRTGSSAVLEGSITSLGSQYVLWLGARNCRTGEAIAEQQAQSERKEDVLKTLGRMAAQMRTRLGESLASLQEHSTPLEQATTASLEALQAYSLAKKAMHASGGPAAIPHLQQAIAIDPQFAVAHADLGFMSWNMGQTVLGAEEVRIAYGLRDRVSDRERRYITMLYDRQVTGNLQKELQTLESWARAYPRDAYAHGILAGWVSFGTANYERGVQASQRAIDLDPGIGAPYSGVALHNLFLNRFAEASEVLRLAAGRNLEIPEFLVTRYYLAFLKGDQAAMDREIARAPSSHAEDQIVHHQALVHARSGRMRSARNLWERAIALARQAGRRETAAIYTAAAAVCEAHAGNALLAKQRARAALELARGRDVLFAAAFALAQSGEMAEAEALAASLAKQFPEDTPVQFEYLPSLRALSALAHGSPLDAVEQLQQAAAYDFALPGTAFFARFGGLYPAFVRGTAYLAARRGPEAAAEFQKILDHPGIVLADPAGALAHLYLGRAYAVSGDPARAKKSYQTFLALWKDADRDIPIGGQARAELAKL